MSPSRPRTAVPDKEQLRALRRTRWAQGGAVTRAQALECGYGPGAVRSLLRRGEWTDLERGIYVEGHALSTADPWTEHALRVAARVIAVGGSHRASRRSASLVLGLPLLGSAPVPPELVRAPRSPTDRSSSPSIKVATLPEQDVVRWRDVDCTAPARLVCDLARTHGQVEALMVADAALRAGLPREALLAAADRCARWVGATAVPEVVDAANARTDSPLESLTRWVLRRLGLPAPLSQVDVLHRGRFLGRVDFAWPELGVVLEADGMSKYSDGALKKEKQRELGLRRAGVEVLRSTWDDAWHRPELLRTLWQQHVALAAASSSARRETQFRLPALEPAGMNGIPFPSRAARPLPGPTQGAPR